MLNGRDHDGGTVEACRWGELRRAYPGKNVERAFQVGGGLPKGHERGVQKEHAIAGNDPSAGVSELDGGGRGGEVPRRDATGGKVCEEVICATAGGGEEGRVVRPVVGLGESGDGPCLAARPAGVVAVTLVCHLSLYRAGSLVEIDNVSSGKVRADMVSLR